MKVITACDYTCSDGEKKMRLDKKKTVDNLTKRYLFSELAVKLSEHRYK